MSSNLAADLKKLSPTASKKIIDGIVANAHFLDEAKITTPLRMRQFFARVCVETGGLRQLAENLDYSAARLTEVWPKRFPNLAAAKPYEHNPRKLGNKVYGGRLGNSAKNDDGYNYRGSGLLQDTGKVNFQICEEETGLPVVANPDMLRVFPSALEAATIYWTKHNLNKLADKNDTRGLCVAINGGTNGLADQKVWLAKAEKIWPDGAALPLMLVSKPAPAPAPEKPSPVEDPAPAVVVPDPPTKAVVQGVQQRLFDLNYNPGTKDPVKGWDGIPGRLTNGAILSFKNDHDLPVNTDIDEAFLATLATAKPREMAPARANATESEVAAKVPEANVHWWNKVGAMVGGGSVAVGGAADYASQATGYLTTVRDFFTDIPSWVYIVGFLVLCAALYLASQRGVTKTAEAFRNGDRR